MYHFLQLLKTDGDSANKYYLVSLNYLDDSPHTQNDSANGQLGPAAPKAQIHFENRNLFFLALAIRR